MTARPEGSPAGAGPPGAPPPPGEAAYFVTGVIYQVLRPGDGSRHPGPADEVRARYGARTEDGRVVEDTGGAAILRIAELPPGVAEALQVMTPGERGRAWVPARLAGPGARGTAVYDIELEAVTRAEPAPGVPPNLRAPRLDQVHYGDPPPE